MSFGGPILAHSPQFLVKNFVTSFHSLNRNTVLEFRDKEEFMLLGFTVKAVTVQLEGWGSQGWLVDNRGVENLKKGVKERERLE